MTKDANHGPMWSIVIKSLVFTVVTVTATGILATTIRNSSAGEAQDYTAIFNDATSVNRGDDVRIAGVKVGTVKDVSVADNRLAKVSFTIRKGVRVNAGSVIQIKFRNLVGQRYLAVEQPAEAGTGTGGSDIKPASAATGTEATIKPGHTFGVDETRPALDLTVLFNGFRPLLRMLNPDDVNALSEQIIAVFQGEDATVDGLLREHRRPHLDPRREGPGDRRADHQPERRDDGGERPLRTARHHAGRDAAAGLGVPRGTGRRSVSPSKGWASLTTRVADLVNDVRPPLRKSIAHVGVLSANLDKHSVEVDSFLQKLPVSSTRIGRLGSYGSWLNFYLCSMDGRIPMPEGYMGDLGVKPVAGRCR